MAPQSLEAYSRLTTFLKALAKNGAIVSEALVPCLDDYEDASVYRSFAAKSSTYHGYQRVVIFPAVTLDWNHMESISPE